LVCADYGAVDNGSGLIDLDLQLLEDRRPVALLRPVRKPVVDRLPRAKPLRQITPRAARFRAVQHGFNEETIAPDSLWSGSLARQDLS
jgi:hypothetical protein